MRALRIVLLLAGAVGVALTFRLQRDESVYDNINFRDGDYYGRVVGREQVGVAGSPWYVRNFTYTVPSVESHQSESVEFRPLSWSALVFCLSVGCIGFALRLERRISKEQSEEPAW